MTIFGGLKGLVGINHFHRERFEDLISRRGWVPVLWERAVRCSCYSENTGNPDPRCPSCHGVGYIYQQDLDMEVHQEQLDITLLVQSQFSTLCSFDGTPDTTKTVDRVVRLWNETKGGDLTVSAISGRQVSVSGPSQYLPDPGDKVYIRYFFKRPTGASVKAIITSVDYQKDYIPSGEWLQGDSIMTVSGQYLMGFRDRITIPEQAVRASELKRRYEVDVLTRSLERLRYKSGITILLCRDLYRTFLLDTDFTLGPDMTIVWGAGARPTHKAFKVRYTGNATTAMMQVTPTALIVTLVGQTDGSTSLNLLFSQYPTVKDLVDKLNTCDKYSASFEEQSNIAGVDNAEDNTHSVLIASTSIKNVYVTVFNEDKTQYTIEYVHEMAYSVYMRQGMVRRHDAGTVLPGKYWLRLWEHTDLFSNA